MFRQGSSRPRPREARRPEVDSSPRAFRAEATEFLPAKRFPDVPSDVLLQTAGRASPTRSRCRAGPYAGHSEGAPAADVDRDALIGRRDLGRAGARGLLCRRARQRYRSESISTRERQVIRSRARELRLRRATVLCRGTRPWGFRRERLTTPTRTRRVAAAPSHCARQTPPHQRRGASLSRREAGGGTWAGSFEPRPFDVPTRRQDSVLRSSTSAPLGQAA